MKVNLNMKIYIQHYFWREIYFAYKPKYYDDMKELKEIINEKRRAGREKIYINGLGTVYIEDMAKEENEVGM